MRENKSRIDHLEILKKLTLPLSTSEKPFKLEGIENDFCCDDWAWFFLRLNEDYQIAFEAQQKDSEKIKVGDRYLADSSEALAFKDKDGSCAKKFGLAAWLDPKVQLLPKLKGSRSSWFFPLTHLVSEDTNRIEVSDKPYKAKKDPYSDDEDAHDLLLVRDTPFGYRPKGKIVGPNYTSSPQAYLRYKNRSERNVISVAIDCGVPVEGQLSSLKTLAEITRTKLRKKGLKTYDRDIPLIVNTIQESTEFAHMSFKTSGAIEVKPKPEDDLSFYWREAAVDALGPIVNQIKKLTKVLKKEHEIFLTQQKALKSPIPGGFMTDLPTSITNRLPQHGGNYLKALLVITEMDKQMKSSAYNANFIFELIKGDLNDRSAANQWLNHFRDNIELKYLPQGKKFIEGGYKWLIAYQKPRKKHAKIQTKSTRPHPRDRKFNLK